MTWTLSRRDFLSRLSALGLFGTAGPATAKPLSGARVLVLGAGISGLAAAREAQQAGAEVTVIEARNRIGGRIWSPRSLGVPVDMGASWIHGPRGNPITQLARKVQAPRHRTNFESVTAYGPDGTPATAREIAQRLARVEQLEGILDNRARTGETMAAALTRLAPTEMNDPITRAMLGGFLEFDGGAAFDQLSALPYEGTDEFDGEDVLFPQGNDAILAALTPGLNIQLRQVISRVSAAKSGVILTGPNGSWQGDYCIVTLPIGVLKSGAVRFSPGLPAPLSAAITRIGAGLVNKVALRFDRAFWGDEQLIFSARRDHHFPMFLNSNVFQPGANILVNYALGRFAAGSEQLSSAALGRMLSRQLALIYGTRAIAPVQVLASRWQADPYARCSYSFATPDTRTADFRAFETLLAGRVSFAGEHTSARYRATVHGAYLSGLRAAKSLADRG